MVTATLSDRGFLLLQGPQSKFFKILAKKILCCGGRAVKLNLCGGDVFLWGRGVLGVKSLRYHGRPAFFPDFIADVYKSFGITDIVLYGDWRPMHQDAVLIAKNLKLKVWVFEEGYLRQGFVTLEENGVNGRSSLPHSPLQITHEADKLPDFQNARDFGDSITAKVHFAICHHVGNVLLFPFFPFYRTHRFTNILVELTGILPRYLMRHVRKARSAKVLSSFLRSDKPYWFYPLQLNTDSQIQLYSPYIRQEEAITTVIASFAKAAPKDHRLLIKNHPLDNGLIAYKDFIKSMSLALGVSDRVVFVEDGNINALIAKSQGVVLINSTVGLSALRAGKKVYCLGAAIYAMKGLAADFFEYALDNFWSEGKEPDKKLLEAFCKVLRQKALVEGSFYTKDAAFAAADEAIARFSAVN